MNDREFDELIREAIKRLPAQIREKLHNTIFQVKESGRDSAGEELLGLYEGTPYPDRGDGDPVMPDRITLYKKPIEREGRTREGILRVIRETILHEVGHFLGLDEDELDEMGLG